MPAAFPGLSIGSYLLYPILRVLERFSIKPNVVQSVSDLVQASHLLYEEGGEEHFCPKMTLQMHYSPFMLTEDCRIFILRRKENAVGTLSIFPDFEQSLPIDKIFPVETRLLRLQGFKLAEIGLLALSGMRKGWGLYGGISVRELTRLFSLLRVSMQYAVYQDVTHIVLAVSPKQKALFSYFGFAAVIEDGEQALANGVPIDLLVLDLEQFAKSRPFLMKLLLKGAAASEEFCAMDITESLLSFQELCIDSIEPIAKECTVRPRVFLGYELEQ